MESTKTTSPEGRGVHPLLLALAVYTVAAVGRGILDADEGVYAHIPQEMLERGDWLTPYVNGVRSLDKPPLLYWLTAISYTIFGVNAFAAHVPGVLGVVGTAWMVQRLASRAAGDLAGRYAAIAFAFSVGTFLFTLEVMHDILLVFFLSLAINCLAAAYERVDPRLWPVLGFFAATAGAFLSKGLIGFAFPAGVAVLYIVVTRDLPEWRLRWLVWGGLLFATLALPWYLAMEARNPGFLEIHFLEEQILRFFNQREPVDFQSVPILLFWLLVPVWLFPYSVFLPSAISLRLSPAFQGEWFRRILILSVCWFGLVLGFFSVSSRLEHYAFPLLPPLAVIVGVTLAVSARSLVWGFRVLAGLGGILLVACAGLVWVRLNGLALEGVGATQTGRNYDNDFTVMFELPAAIIHELLIPAIAVTLCLGVGLLAAQFFAKRNRLQPALASILAAMVVFHLSAAHSLRICEDVVSSRKFGEILAKVAAPGDKVVIVGDYESANSINFYAPVQLMVCEGSAASLGAGLRYPDAPQLVVSKEELRELWQSDKRTYVLLSDHTFDTMNVGSVLDEIAGRSLAVNQPSEP